MIDGLEWNGAPAPTAEEGTYPLPEAQLDRFLMHVKIGFPDAHIERKILQQARGL